MTTRIPSALLGFSLVHDRSPHPAIIIISFRSPLALKWLLWFSWFLCCFSLSLSLSLVFIVGFLIVLLGFCGVFFCLFAVLVIVRVIVALTVMHEQTSVASTSNQRTPHRRSSYVICRDYNLTRYLHLSIFYIF